MHGEPKITISPTAGATDANSFSGDTLPEFALVGERLITCAAYCTVSPQKGSGRPYANIMHLAMFMIVR